MPKDTFVFRKEWRDAISGLPAEVRLEVYEAVIEYGLSGTLTDLKPMAMLAFKFVKATLDKDSDQSNVISEKRRAAARKRWDANACLHMQTDAKNANAYKEKENEEKETFPPAPPIKEKEKKEKEDLPPLYRAGTPSQTMEARREKFYTSLIAYTEQYGKQMVREFYNYWIEPNRSLTKMRFEMQPTWSTPHRLATWFRKQQQINQRDAVNNRYSTAEERAADAASIVAKFLRSE
jgi:hypothetical protein